MLDNKYVWMNKDSYFSNCIEEIRKTENRLFNLVERNSLTSVVRTMERAIESTCPKFLYQVPYHKQLLLNFLILFFLNIYGKYLHLVSILLLLYCHLFGDVAQLARASGSYPEGRGFDPPSLPLDNQKIYFIFY